MSKSGLEYLRSHYKRSLDFLGGVALLHLTLPAAVLAAAASGTDTKSNPLFKQTRVGRNLQPFDIVKLKTIPPQAEEGQIETQGTYDSRASKIGRFLRQSGADELPQLLDVVTGDMSLVGIRPLLAEEITALEDVNPRLFREWIGYYWDLKPSMVGPSQFYRHRHKVQSEKVWEESMRLDIDYVKNASIRKDLQIIMASPISLIQARRKLVDNSEEPGLLSALTTN